MSIYRLVQGALSNCISYAHASEVRVVLNKNPQYQTLILQIAVGRQDCIQNSSTNDMGLARMRKRVFSLDGEIQIVSEQVDGICAGMVINIKLPM